METKVFRVGQGAHNTMSSTNQFTHAHETQDSVENDDEFPFHSMAMSHEAIPAVLSSSGDDLLRAAVEMVL